MELIHAFASSKRPQRGNSPIQFVSMKNHRKCIVDCAHQRCASRRREEKQKNYGETREISETRLIRTCTLNSVMAQIRSFVRVSPFVRLHKHQRRRCRSSAHGFVYFSFTQLESNGMCAQKSNKHKGVRFYLFQSVVKQPHGVHCTPAQLLSRLRSHQTMGGSCA